MFPHYIDKARHYPKIAISPVKQSHWLFLLAFLLIIPAHAHAITYYVDATAGIDSNNGTTTPWKTIAKVNGRTFLPGDSILFKRGCIWREQLTIPNSGTAGNPITFGAYGSGDKPIINGSNIVSGWSQYSGKVYRASIAAPSLIAPCVYTTHSSYPSLTYYSNGYANLSAGQFDYNGGYLYINLGGANPSLYTIESIVRQYCINNIRGYINIDSLHLTHAQDGIGQWNYEADYCAVTNCTFDWISDQGIYAGQSASITAKYWQVSLNTFDHIGCYQSGTRGRHGIYTKWAQNWTIEQNNFTNCGYGVINGGCGINLNGSSYTTVRYNYFNKCTTGSIQLFQDTAGGSSYNQIYYNVSNGGTRFVFVGGGADHIGNVLYNNTAYGFTYAGIEIEGSSTGSVTAKNNIFSSSVPNVKIYSISSGPSLAASDYNNMGPEASGFISFNGTAYSTLAAFRLANSAFDVHSISTDPKFVSPGTDLHLIFSSPCVNAGTNVSLTRDFDGNSVTSEVTPSMGAYQYQKPNLNPPVIIIFSP